MGKKPFSTKQKREQLRQKRLAAAHQNHITAQTSSPPPTTTASTNPPPQTRRTRPRATKGSNSHRYRLQLACETQKAEPATHDRELAHTPLDPVSIKNAPVTDVDALRPREFTVPRRPAWKYSDSVEQLNVREERLFADWVERMKTSSYFERNLETWRQLWRVLERSDVLILVADARYAALHFVPDLYTHVTQELGKGMILALNKVDLVSKNVLNAWKEYFAQRYPKMAITTFTSFPDERYGAREEEGLSKRERRMRRGRLAAWGADQLLLAMDDVPLDKKKRSYLEEWRQRVVVDDDTCVYGKEDGAEEGMVTIGVVGHPNAGKSSLINGIFGKKVVSTSRTPGHTKHLQTIFLTERVRLCDCPGLVFASTAPRELQIVAGMYPISQVREPYATVRYIAERIDLVVELGLRTEITRLQEYMEEPEYCDTWTAWKICEAWAMKRGFRTAKAARLDVFRAANGILRMVLEGRIVLVTVPEGFIGDVEGDGVEIESETEGESESESESGSEEEPVTAGNAFDLLAEE